MAGTSPETATRYDRRQGERYCAGQSRQTQRKPTAEDGDGACAPKRLRRRVISRQADDRICAWVFALVVGFLTIHLWQHPKENADRAD